MVAIDMAMVQVYDDAFPIVASTGLEIEEFVSVI